jgi:hypothetical protein
MHLTKFKFLNLTCPKLVKFFISIRVCGKFQLLFTCALVGFREDIQQFISKLEKKINVEGLVAPLAISYSDDVQRNVKHKFHFDELK